MKIYRTSEDYSNRDFSNKTVFLAGSIDLKLSGNWREELALQFGDEVCFFDPTRYNHDELNDEEMKNHIQWEHETMEMVDVILINFLPKAKSPISLAELGLYARSSKLIVVCPDEFYEKHYVKSLCDRFEIPFYSSLSQGIIHLKIKI